MKARQPLPAELVSVGGFEPERYRLGKLTFVQ